MAPALPLFEHVTHAAHGVQQRRLEGLIELDPEAPNGDLHHVGVAVEVHIPDLGRELRARKDFAFAPQQQCQQRELLGREIDAGARPEDLAFDQIDFEIGDMKHRGLGETDRALIASQQDKEACHQLGECKRLDQVVVRSALQAPNPVFDLRPGRQHQDRRLLGLPQGRQHGKTVDARQHGVENDDVVGLFDRQMKPVDAVVHHVDHKTLFGQALLEIAGQFDFVFDQEQFHAVILSCMAPKRR